MKALIIFSLISTSLLAQTTETEKPLFSVAAEKQSANDLSEEIINHIKEIFLACASAKDEVSARNAIVNMAQYVEKISALKKLLESTNKPTTTEKQTFAIQMIAFETEISNIYTTMFETFQNNTEDVNQLIEPPLSEIKLKIAPALAVINQYYPREEMLKYIRTAKNKNSP